MEVTGENNNNNSHHTHVHVCARHIHFVGWRRRGDGVDSPGAAECAQGRWEGLCCWAHSHGVDSLCVRCCSSLSPSVCLSLSFLSISALPLCLVPLPLCLHLCWCLCLCLCVCISTSVGVCGCVNVRICLRTSLPSKGTRLHIHCNSTAHQ